MYLLICQFFLFLLGTEIIAKDVEPSAEKVILHLNSILSNMVTSDDLATYRNLSSEALKVTQEYFKYEKASAVPDEDDKTKSKEFDKPAGNNTEGKVVDKDITRRNKFSENDPKICSALINNIDAALRLVEANFFEINEHPNCMFSQSVLGQENELAIIKTAIDRWPKGRFWPLVEESGTNKMNPEFKSDLIILASVLAPGFTPTPLQVQRLENILKRSVFVNILHSNPDLCYGYEIQPQVNTLSIPSVKKIWQGKLESGNKNQYNNPQTPFVLNPFSKYQKLVQKPDSLNVYQNSKSSWPLSFTAKEMPTVELNKMLQIISDEELPSNNLYPSPLVTTKPINEKLWKTLVQLLNTPEHKNSGKPRFPILYPTSINTPNEHDKVSLLLNDFPIPKKPIKVPPPFVMDAQPFGNNKISKLSDLPKYTDVPTLNKFSSSAINKPLALPIDAVPIWSNKPIDTQPNQYQLKLFEKYPIHLNPPQKPDYPGNSIKKNMKYPPSLINTPYNSHKYILNDDLPKPDLMIQNLGKEVKPNNPVTYYSNLQKFPVHNLEFYKKYPNDLPKGKNEQVYPPPLLYMKPKPDNNPFILPNKISKWPYQRPSALVNYPKDKLLHKIPTSEHLYGPNVVNPDYDDRTVTQTPPKSIFENSFYQPVVSKYQGPLPLTLEKEDKDDNNNKHRGDYGPKIPFLLHELKNKEKKPYDHYIPNNIIYSKHMKPYIEDEKSDDRIINSLHGNVEDKTELPWNKLSKDLYDTFPLNHYSNKFSPINSNLPADLTFGQIKQKPSKWLQTLNPYLEGLNKNIDSQFFNRNPFKNSYQIYDLLNKTPQELLQGGGETNWIKLATKPSQTEVELIFLMKAQEPIVYWPIYYVSYRIPTIKLIKKFKDTAENKPIISNTDHILYELVNSEPYLTISPELKKLDTEDLYRLLVKNGLVVAANIYKNNQKINREDYLITMDKILSNPSNYEIKSNYFRSGPVRSEDFSENVIFDRSVIPAALNTNLGRRFFTRYYYTPRTRIFAPFSPAIYRLKAQQRLRAIQALKQLQRERDVIYSTLKTRQNKLLYKDAIAKLWEKATASTLKNVPGDKQSKTDGQTIDSSTKGDDKGVTHKEPVVSRAKSTADYKIESKEDLSVRGLDNNNEGTNRLFASSYITDLKKNNTVRSHDFDTETATEIFDRVEQVSLDHFQDKMDVTETSKVPIDDSY